MLHEINGYTVADRKPVEGFTSLKDDGSTACGCWIYSGCYRDGVNHDGAPQAALGAELGCAGMGLGLAAQPPHALQPRLGRSRGQALVGAQEDWSGGTRARRSGSGHDAPDFIVERPPSYRPSKDARGKDTSAASIRSSCKADGKGWIYRRRRACRTARCRRTTSRRNR